MSSRIVSTSAAWFSILALAACGASSPHGETGHVNHAEAAAPPARTSADETDGPTQPRTSPARPVGAEDDGAGD